MSLKPASSLTQARIIRKRTVLAAAMLSAVLSGLIVFASVQVTQGKPTPRTLMVTAAAKSPPPSSIEAFHRPLASSVSPLPPTAQTAPAEPTPEPRSPSVQELLVAGWQSPGDPPLPDHDPWAEMERPAPAASGLTFNGRPLRKVRTLRMLVTAYSPDERSCGPWADGITASGYSVYTNGMKLAAADTRLLPFGTIITVPGYHGGRPVPVLDRGGKIKGKRLDVLYPTHERARQWGSQWLEVTVWDYAD